MGYPVQNQAPQITVQGRTFAIGAFDWANPVGSFYEVGVYEKQTDGSWNQAFKAAEYPNDGDLLADVQKQGGGVKYLAMIVAKINAYFVALFGVQPAPPSTEPTTDAEAKVYAASHINAMTLTLVNGVPVLA